MEMMDREAANAGTKGMSRKKSKTIYESTGNQTSGRTGTRYHDPRKSGNEEQEGWVLNDL